MELDVFHVPEVEQRRQNSPDVGLIRDLCDRHVGKVGQREVDLRYRRAAGHEVITVSGMVVSCVRIDDEGATLWRDNIHSDVLPDSVRHRRTSESVEEFMRNVGRNHRSLRFCSQRSAKNYQVKFQEKHSI